MFLSNGSVVPLQGGALADSTPTFNDTSYYAQNALALESSFAAYGALYRAQLWVGIVVRKKAMATARMPFQIMEQGPGAMQAQLAGPLADLMENPNPEMGAFDLWRWTSSTRDIYGEAFWRKVRDDKGQVRELWPMHPSNVTARRTKDGALEYLLGPTHVIPAADVVKFTAYNPDGLVRGVSSLESLRMTLLNEDASRRATASFWAKGARPSMILTHPQTLSEAAQQRLKHAAESQMSGASRMGGVTVFEEGIVPHTMQLNQEEMQYIESRKLNREEVCAAYDISPLVVHILDHATFSNVTEQLRSQYRDSMAPWFTELEAAVNKQLVPDFYPTTGAVKVKTRFNMDDVLRGDYETRAAATLGLRQSGLITGNEGRVIMGQEPSTDPIMDVYFANAALQPLGTEPARPGSGPALEALPVLDEDPAPADTPRGILPNRRAGGKSFLSRRAKAAHAKAAADRKDLAAAHTETLTAYFAEVKAAYLAAVSEKAAAVPVIDWEFFDANLSEVLLTLARETATMAGTATASKLGGKFDVLDVENWLVENADLSAGKINAATAEALAGAFREDRAGRTPAGIVDDVFDETLAARPGEIAETRVTGIAAFASHDAAQRNGGAVKTWVVNSTNPRPSHADMAGESVPMDDLFSNGMKYPGDWSAGADEVAGCQCTTDYSASE